MSRSKYSWIVLALLVANSGPARAGWVAEWTNVAIKQDGDRLDPQRSSMTIANNRVRLEQPDVVTVIDYNKGSFTVINPSKRYFWTGTVDEYVTEMTTNRARSMREKQITLDKGTNKPGSAASDSPAAPKAIDLTKLPPLSITNTGLKEKIAGFETVKYEVHVGGDLFQELWVAPVDVSGDLNFSRYLDQQRKISAVMLGKSAGPYNALYRNEEYGKLLEKSFVLKLVTHHIAGGFERVATSIKPADVPATAFEVPDAYRRVRLSDVMSAPAPEAPAKKGS